MADVVDVADVAGAGRHESHERTVTHLTPTERAARGKAARNEVPRSSQADYAPVAGRRNPVEILEAQATTRVPELVPIRYGRMLSSPFAFFRGAAAVMAADLATTAHSGLPAQACGDAHMSNFGVYSAPDRRLVFDINDFDETLPGPWEWDVKRLVASLVVAARDNGFAAPIRDRIVSRTVLSYREAMRTFAGMRNLEVWYARLEVETLLQRLKLLRDQKRAQRFSKEIDKARARDSVQAFNKLVTMVDGQPRFISDPPLIQPLDELLPADELPGADEFLRHSIRSYRETLAEEQQHLMEDYRYTTTARKVVGVGSVGTRAWVVLMLGRDVDDPLILQVKEAQQSVLEPYVGRSRHTNAGQRVVAGQKLMQAASDIFLGWERVARGLDGQQRDFYIRQLRDGKGSVVVETMLPDGMDMYGRACGWTLARAHARSGDRIAIASYLGSGTSFDRAMVSFGEAYADQNERDYQSLSDAVNTGAVAAQTGI